MSSYLKTFYFRTEYGENDYPQLLCNHIVEKFMAPRLDVQGKKLLDIGCGKGTHLVGFSRCGMQTYGLDKRGECVQSVEGFDTRQCDIENEPFPYEDNYFDIVFSKSVLEHVMNTENFIGEALRVLKPGGLAVLLTPDWRSNRDWFWDDHTHVKPFTLKSLRNAMLICGFKNVEGEFLLQLPEVWKNPWLYPVTRCFAILPDALRWKDKDEKHFRKWVRFSKEKMLVATGVKTND